MEDQTNGCIYEIASPVELGAAGYRGQALIVRRYARSFCATAPPSRGAGRRPPVLGSPAVDPRGELSE